MSATGRPLVIIPTYNEHENLAPIIDALFREAPGVHVLVVDDNSPDHTGELADAIAARDERVFVQHRSGKQGLGSAYLLGFTWGLEQGYEYLIEMDADGSHPPSQLATMIDSVAAGSAGLAIGSRWVHGGSVVNWPWHRELLSRSANLYTRIMLGIGVRDATAGFRVYHADVLGNIERSGIDSRGYCFQIDMTLRVLDEGYTVIEHPITFKDRERGESKMSGSIVREAMVKVTVWGIRRRFHQLRAALSPRRY